MPNAVTFIGSIPNEIWSGLFGALIAGVMASLSTDKANKHNLATLKLQHEHEELLNRQQLARERLEELHVLAAQWEQTILRNCRHLTEAINGKIDYETYEKKVVETASLKGNLERLEMIVAIYGSKVQLDYNRLVEALHEVNEIQVKFKRNKVILNKETLTTQLNKAQSDLWVASSAFKDSIANAVITL